MAEMAEMDWSGLTVGRRPLSFFGIGTLPGQSVAEAFDLFDTDGSGEIDSKELKVRDRRGDVATWRPTLARHATDGVRHRHGSEWTMRPDGLHGPWGIMDRSKWPPWKSVFLYIELVSLYFQMTQSAKRPRPSHASKQVQWKPPPTSA